MHFSLVEKLGASALLCAWLVYGSMNLGHVFVHVREHQSTMEVAKATSGAKPEAAVAEADLGTLLASATPDAGEKIFNKCKACHGIDKGGPNKVGPNLYNVVGGPKAHAEGFAYSPTLAGMHSQTWTYEDLYTFLANPKQYIAGTKMTFAGLSDGKDRAAVIRYLAANTTNPPPLPEPAPKTAAAETSPPAASGKTATQAAAATAAPDTGAVGDIKERLASADAAAGEKVFGKCKACHNAEKGGANQVGPNLWGVIGRPVAAHDGFSYSAALAAKKGDSWSYEQLDTYLASPKAWAPGTKMTFAGLNKPGDRADVIAYLLTKADSPPPVQ